MEVPCGRCYGCRREYRRVWALRCMHEASLHERNSFLTLTFAEDPISLDVRYLQLFFKRLRKRGLSVRQYSCGEYGEELGRPHYHVLLFGEDFSFDRYLHEWRDGFPIFRSPVLEACWPHGFSEIGAVTFESASYVAGYVQKKLSGERAEHHYMRVDEATGECIPVKPEFCVMSRGGRGYKGGIGRDWFLKFRAEIARDDSVLSRGRESPVPRYYRNKLAEVDPQRAEELRVARVARAKERAADNTPERLAVREEVARARAKLKERRRYENGDV